MQHFSKGLIDSEKFVEQALRLLKLSASDVLIIDDIERIKNPLDYETLLGFISRNFLEKENAVKVILIANEEFLSQRKDSEYYFKIKEKTIWKTLNYKTDISSVYDNLTSHFTKIEHHLHKQKDLTIKLLTKYKIENLRTILFFFGVLEVIAEKTGFNIFKQESFEKVYNSILIICNEYKSGFLYSNDSSINYLKTEIPVVQFEYDFEGIDLFDKEDKAEIKPEKEEHNKLVQYFSKRYLYPNKPNYKFIKSLIHYVQTSNLDDIALVDEINLLNKEIIAETDESKLLNSLNDISLLDNDRFISNWNEIIEAISKECYDFHELEFILYTFGKYSKWLDFPQDDEFQRVFREVIPKSKLSSQNRYNPYYGFKTEIMEDSEIFRLLVELVDDRSQNLLRNSRKKELESLLRNLTIEEPINFVSLGNYFANASQDKIKELIEVITSNAKRTSDFSRILYDAKREFRIHRSSTYFSRNVEYFLSNLEESIDDRTPQSLSLIGIKRVFEEYIMN